MENLIEKTQKSLDGVLTKLDVASQPGEIRELAQGAMELARTLELLKKQAG